MGIEIGVEIEIEVGIEIGVEIEVGIEIEVEIDHRSCFIAMALSIAPILRRSAFDSAASVGETSAPIRARSMAAAHSAALRRAMR